MKGFYLKTKRAHFKKINLRVLIVIALILLVALFFISKYMIAKHIINKFEKPLEFNNSNITNYKSEDYISKDNSVGYNNTYNSKIAFDILSPTAIEGELIALLDAGSQLEKYEPPINLGFIANSGFLTHESIEKSNLPVICINDFCVYVEIANTIELRQKGLSLREGLSKDLGMLFVFKEPSHLSFWMKDMLFSLDMIWLSQDGKILHIEKDTLPCGFECPNLSPPKTEEFLAKYVLEVNAGLSEIYNISIGDFAKIKI